MSTEPLVEIRPDDGGHLLEARIVLPRPLDEVFSFFSDAGNLERITPRFLRFRVLTPRPIAIGSGTIIDYRLRLHGVPLQWRTLISAWQPPGRFVDTQLRGPYASWMHEHRFVDLGSETLCTDAVRYRLRGGRLAHDVQNAAIAARDLRRIFRYRHIQLERLLGAAGGGGG